MAVESAPSDDKQTNKEVNSCYRDNERQKFREQQGEPVLDRIYVGGLGQHIYEKDLYGFFSQFGEVSYVGIITDGDYSKGYGFVTFARKDVVRGLLEEPHDEPLVLKGRVLTIGPARQKQDNSWGRGYSQGWRRQRANYSQVRVEDHEGPASTTPDSSKPVMIKASSSDDSLPVDIDSYSYDSSCLQPAGYPQEQGTQLSVYPTQYPLPSYPLQYPHYQHQGHEYPQYPVYQTVPIQVHDNAWYQTNYQPTTQVYQDPSTCTSAQFPAPSPLYEYPAYYSTVPETTHQYPYPAGPQVSPSDPALIPYWPQSQVQPILYNHPQSSPTMIQYSYPACDPLQPVCGYHEPGAGQVQDSYAYQEIQSVNHEGAVDLQSFSDHPSHALTDSGFQDTLNSDQDVSSTYQDQSNSQHKVTSSESQQKSPSNLNQEQSRFTKLMPVDSHREFDRNQPPRHLNGYPRPGRDTRVFPSLYKSFSPYTGHPSPRQFPMQAGPRPYYSGQGHRGGGQGENSGRSIQKKKQVKKDAAASVKVGGGKEGVLSGGGVGHSGDHPDILQGPLEKLEVK